MTDPPRFTMGAALEECYAAATFDWCKHHAGSMTHAEAFAREITSVLVQTMLGAFGKVNVTITISGRRRCDDAAYFWRFTRSTNSTWILHSGSLDL
jgi:hypothetical protein